MARAIRTFGWLCRLCRRPARRRTRCRLVRSSSRWISLSALLDQLLWITLAGKPENDRLRIVAEGECAAESTARQLADMLNGVVILAESGLNDARTRRGLDPAMREAYLELLKTADVSKLDRGNTKSVRLIFEITPNLLEAACASVKDSSPARPARPRL